VTTTLFDIAADLDTPGVGLSQVETLPSAFPAGKRGRRERLARYSFIGFGDCMEYRLDAAGLMVNGAREPRPAGQAELLASLRQALAQSPRPDVTQAGFPLLVAWSAPPATTSSAISSACRQGPRVGDDVPEAHYVAPVRSWRSIT